MRLSESRILTTDVGSLPRSGPLLKMLLAMEQGGSVEREAFRTQVVADRICQFVDAVGDRERVIASCDCGFSTFAGRVMVPADVAWKKMEMLTTGARLASDRLR